MKSQNQKLLSSLLTAALLLVILVPPPASAVFNKNGAIDYLKNQPIDEWSVMALSTAGSLSNVNLNFLKNDPGSTPTDIEKRILGIVAAGQNPETFGSSNLIQKLTGFFDGTQINPTSGSNLLNDDIFGLLSLSAANKELAIRNQLASFIKNNQNSDGGWGFSLSPSVSDSNDTAMAIMALLSNGESSSSASISKGFNYLATAKTATGYSFDATSGFGPDAASTAWVISAHRSAGKTPPISAVTFLENLQQTNGSFSWQPGQNGSALMTAYALIALNDHFYPVRGTSTNTTSTSAGNTSSPKFQVSIIGPTSTIFSGEVSFRSTSIIDNTGQTHSFQPPLAIGTISEAAKISGFAYVIKNTSLGLFVESIAGFGPAGDKGWQYAINGTKPNIGSASKTLNNGDKVVWFYGSPSDQPPAGSPSSGSNQNSSTVSQVSQTINLSANITSVSSGTNNTNNPQGNTNGANTGNQTSTIIFGVDTADINFGQLSPGAVSLAKAVKLTNSGSVNLNITAQVQGTDNLYPDGIYLNSISWPIYNSNLPSHTSNDVSVVLFVPSNYPGAGTKTGTLTFWAKAQ